MSDTPKFIEGFMEAVYPGAGHLALSSFSEKKVLEDATAEITRLRSLLDEAKAALREFTYDNCDCESCVSIRALLAKLEGGKK